MSAVRSPLFYLRRAETCREKLLEGVQVQALHAFRTSLRRLEAVMRLEKRFWKKDGFEKEIKTIKTLLRWTGPLWEKAVYSEILRSAGLSPEEINFDGEPGMEEKFQSFLGRPVFGRFFSDMGGTLREIREKERTREWRSGIEDAFNDEVNLARRALADYERKGPQRKVLHRLRVRAKRLRYNLEFFDFLNPPRKEKLFKAAAQAQDRLGQLRDWQGLEKFLKRPGAANRMGKGGLEIIKRNEEKLLDRAQKSIRLFSRITG